VKLSVQGSFITKRYNIQKEHYIETENNTIEEKDVKYYLNSEHVVKYNLDSFLSIVSLIIR